MTSMWIIWLIIAGFSFLLEILTVGFFMFWLGIAAILSLLISLVGLSTPVQVIVFALSSILMIIFTKPLVSKYFKVETKPTNVNAIIGKKGVVTEDIINVSAKGQVKIEGELWSAVSNEDSKVIKKGTNVEVVQVKGVKLVVKKND